MKKLLRLVFITAPYKVLLYFLDLLKRLFEQVLIMIVKILVIVTLIFFVFVFYHSGFSISRTFTIKEITETYNLIK